MNARQALLAAIAAATALAGCRSEGDIVVEQGVGITALRSVCPAVGVPDFTGDVALFAPEDARTADALDVTASITNEAVKELGLKVGSPASAVIKASDVMVGVDD